MENGQSQKNAPPVKREGAKARKRREAEERQALSKKRKTKQILIDRLETKITELEARQTEITTLLEQPDTYANGGQAQALNRELMELNEDLEQHNLEWSQAVDALNAIG